MFAINEDLSIYITRGDFLTFSLSVEEDDGSLYTFQPGDVVRVKVFGKKDCDNVYVQKKFPITEETDTVSIFLTKEETKFGNLISKPKDYWYEVELNPDDSPKTLIGYDEDGEKVFRLFPEGGDVDEAEPDPEEFLVVDAELDLTSERPVQNQVVARAILQHNSNKNNPHGVTIQQIGAAPSGFGLGYAKRITASELDSTTAPGFYDIAETMTINNITANYWYMVVSGMSNGTIHCTQELRPVGLAKCRLERSLRTGKWDAWGCDNPTMLTGVEYRTTELFNGKYVYIKLLNFEALPNSAQKTVSLNAVPTEIIEIKPQIVLWDSDTVGTFCQETAPSAEFANSVRFLATISTSGGSVLCHTNRDMTKYVAKVVVKYTKD